MTNFIQVKEKKKSSHQALKKGRKLGLPLAHAGKSHANRKLREENRRILDREKFHIHR